MVEPSIVDLAAEVIHECMWGDVVAFEESDGTAQEFARALAAAGLLLTYADRAVLDAAEAWRAADTEDSTYLQRCQSIYNLRMTTRRRKVAS